MHTGLRVIGIPIDLSDFQGNSVPPVTGNAVVSLRVQFVVSAIRARKAARSLASSEALYFTLSSPARPPGQGFTVCLPNPVASSIGNTVHSKEGSKGPAALLSPFLIAALRRKVALSVVAVPTFHSVPGSVPN